MAEINVNLTINGESDVKEIAKALYEAVKKYQPKEEPLAVGSYAVTLTDSLYKHIKKGEIVEVVSSPDKDGLIDCRRIGDEESDGLFKRNQLKVFSALESKWVAIGRKPNEFKEGDAVRYKNAFTTVVESVRGRIRINQSNNAEKQIIVQPTDLTLIFPVEAKFE